jgi:DNA-binding NarL/FixJ family response regulator
MKNSIRIVVSDDSRMARRGLIALLHSIRIVSDQYSKFEVVGESSNGREAIGLTKVLNPDVVFIDACMPVLNGIEATKQIKAENNDVKVIVTSMYAKNRLPAYEAGADVFLEKGIDNKNLCEIIQNLLSNRS